MCFNRPVYVNGSLFILVDTGISVVESCSLNIIQIFMQNIVHPLNHIIDQTETGSGINSMLQVCSKNCAIPYLHFSIL